MTAGEIGFKTKLDNKALEKDLKQTTKDIKTLQDGIAEGNKTISDEEQAAKKSAEAADKAAADKAAAQQQRAAAEAQIAAAEERAAKAAAEMERLKGQSLTHMETEAQQAAERVAELQKRMEELDTRRAPIAEQAAKLSEELSNAKANLDALKTSGAGTDAIVAAEEKVRTLEVNLGNAERRLRRLDSDARGLAPDIQRAAAEAQQLSERLTTARETGKVPIKASAGIAVDNEAQAAAAARAQAALAAQAAAAAEERAAAAEREARQEAEAHTAAADNMRATVQKIEGGLNDAQARAGTLQKKLSDAAAAAGNPLNQAVDRIGSRIDGLGKTLARSLRRIFFLGFILKGLRALRDYFGQAIKASGEASAAIGQLKGALLTMAYPIVQAVLPAFTALLNILTQVVLAIAQLVAMIFGTTVKAAAAGAKALNKETAALGGAGKAAKKAAKSFASFDEINQIQTKEEDSGSGGGAGAGAITPNFDTDAAAMDLDKLLNLIRLIGAALLALKFGDGFFDSLQKFVGFLIFLDGLIRFIKNGFDAWNNGITFDNLAQMILGLIEMIAGLTIALGPTAGAIAAVVGGLALLAVGFHDAFKNGWTLENELAVLAGIISTGLGLAFLSGSVIPAVLAALLALGIALAIATGHGQELLDGAKLALQGFLDFFKGVFAGDVELQLKGIGEIFDGFGKFFNAMWQGFKDTVNSFLDWLDQKTNGMLRPLIEAVRGAFNAFCDNISKTFSGMWDGLRQVMEGIIQFVNGVFMSDWDLAWEGVKNVFKGFVNGVISLIEGMLNLLLDGFRAAIQSIGEIKAPDWVPIIGGKTWSLPQIPQITLPRLATGAVIPPNREFMAVLGDQKSGTNIEAPLETIRQAMLEALSESGRGRGEPTPMTVILQLDRREFGRAVLQYGGEETARVGVRMVTT